MDRVLRLGIMCRGGDYVGRLRPAVTFPSTIRSLYCPSANARHVFLSSWLIFTRKLIAPREGKGDLPSVLPTVVMIPYAVLQIPPSQRTHDAITRAREKKRERQIDEDIYGDRETGGTIREAEQKVGWGGARTNPTKYWLTSGWQISLATHPFGLQLAAYTEPNAFEYHLLLPTLFVMLICCQPRRGAQPCACLVGDRFRLITRNEVCKFDECFIIQIWSMNRSPPFFLPRAFLVNSSGCFAMFAMSLRGIARDYLIGLWLLYQRDRRPVGETRTPDMQISTPRAIVCEALDV